MKRLTGELLLKLGEQFTGATAQYCWKVVSARILQNKETERDRIVFTGPQKRHALRFHVDFLGNADPKLLKLFQ